MGHFESTHFVLGILRVHVATYDPVSIKKRVQLQALATMHTRLCAFTIFVHDCTISQFGTPCHDTKPACHMTFASLWK